MSKIANVDYVVYGWNHAGYSPDNGQVLTISNCCLKHTCCYWEGDIQMAPKLIRNDKGFRICPVCHSSYGS